MSNNTEKQTNKYVSRWFSNATTNEEFSLTRGPFNSRKEAYDYTRRFLNDHKYAPLPFASIWERKYRLLDLASAVGDELVDRVLKQLQEKLQDYPERASICLKLTLDEYYNTVQLHDLVERIKKTIKGWQEENNINIPSYYPVGWCDGDALETIASNRDNCIGTDVITQDMAEEVAE